MLFKIFFKNINRYTSNIPEKEHEQSSCDAEQKDLQEGERTLLHKTSHYYCMFWVVKSLQLLLQKLTLYSYVRMKAGLNAPKRILLFLVDLEPFL